MKRIILAILLLATAAGAAWWWFLPEQVLKRRTISLLETLTLSAGEGISSRQMKVYSLHALLAEQVVLANPRVQEANGEWQRADVEAAFSAVCQHAKMTQFDLLEIREFIHEGDKVTMQITLDAKVEMPEILVVNGKHHAKLIWTLHEQGWLLESSQWQPLSGD